MITEEEYMDQKGSTDQDRKDENHRYEQQVLFNKNSKAVMQAINDQNAKIAEMQNKIVMYSNTLGTLQSQLAEIKKVQMNELIAKLGNGPTVVED